MAPKKNLIKKGQAMRDHEQFYVDAIRRLKETNPDEWRKAEMYVTGWGISYEEAYKQIQLERYQKYMSLRLPAEDGECPDCQSSYSRLKGRAKLRSKKCGHLLCESCRDDFYELHPGKCSAPGCGQMLRYNDFEPWQPPVAPSKYKFGELPPMELPQHEIERLQAKAALARQQFEQSGANNADDEGLFVPEEPGSGMAGDQDGGDGDDGEVQVKEEISEVEQDKDEDSDFEITYGKGRRL